MLHDPNSEIVELRRGVAVAGFVGRRGVAERAQGEESKEREREHGGGGGAAEANARRAGEKNKGKEELWRDPVVLERRRRAEKRRGARGTGRAGKRVT